MKELVGKTISGLSVNDDQSALRFDTKDGPITFNAVGDCCSQSWFADINGVDALIGGTVASVEEVGMDGYNVDDGRGRQEVDSAYGYKIATDKGNADVVFRNSSNGYYGGWLTLGKDQYGHELESSADEKMTPITTDWSA